MLLPKYDEWKAQAASRNGDKTVCCDKFLNHVIPYLVEVLVQDSIYFTQEFPLHPMNAYITRCVQRYESWAPVGQQCAKYLEDT